MTEFPSTAYVPRLDERATREELVMPILIYVGVLLSHVTGGLSFVVSLIAAYALKREATPAARSHYVYAIRTCWGVLGWTALGIVVVLVGLPLTVVLIGFPVMALGGLIIALAAVWCIARAIVGIVRAADGRPQPNPRALLV